VKRRVMQAWKLSSYFLVISCVLLGALVCSILFYPSLVLLILPLFTFSMACGYGMFLAITIIFPKPKKDS